MTANLTVPADVWTCKQPGVPLVAAIVEGEPCEPCDVCPDGFIEDWDTGRLDPCPTCNGTMRKTTTDQEAE